MFGLKEVFALTILGLGFKRNRSSEPEYIPYSLFDLSHFPPVCEDLVTICVRLFHLYTSAIFSRKMAFAG